MSKQRYAFTLTAEERSALLAIVQKGVSPARRILRANVLLCMDQRESRTQREVASLLRISTTSIQLICKQFIEHGLEATLTRKQRPSPPTPLICTPDIQLMLCGLLQLSPPPPHRRWTHTLLANQLMKSGAVAHISPRTVGRVLANQ